MTRDRSRPPEHPLVELAHDLWDGLGRVYSDHGDPTEDESQRFEQLHGALRSVRRFVDALELVVDELEAQSRARSAAPPDGNGTRDDDFQIITISPH